ncbi:MAG: hypothetical protein J6J05_08860, partial [Peptococcaceae bacterium]|nr:hypothetical protein [Peptococcaceae bacterium]
LHHFKKSAVLLIALALIVTVGVGSTLAYLIDTSTEVTNTFQPSEVTCRVDETFKDNVKSAVRIQNTSDTGDVDAYIRAAVIVTWKKYVTDENGKIIECVAGEKPISKAENEADYDYEITYNLSSGWVKGTDGYYYYTSPVPVDAFTNYLIENCKLKDGVTPPSGYYLSVEIVAEAIQAEPADAVEKAWGVTVANDGTISK